MAAGSSSSSPLTLGSSSCSCSGSAVPEYESNGETDGDTSSMEQGREVVSLLDRLKRATPADIARSRKVRKNNPPRGKRPCRGTLESDPKRVITSQRVKEFAIIVFRGQLWHSLLLRLPGGA